MTKNDRTDLALFCFGTSCAILGITFLLMIFLDGGFR